MVMAEDFGLPVHVVGGFANGIEQVEALNSGIDVDFAVIADANVFMAAHQSTVNSYRYLLPCFWQKQYLITPSDRRGYHHQLLWYANGSSGEEQVRLRAHSLDAYLTDIPRRLEIHELSNKILELEKGEGLLAWEPFVSMYCFPGASLDALEAGDYRLSTSLYCHRGSIQSTHFPGGMPFRSVLSLLGTARKCLIQRWLLDFSQGRSTAKTLARLVGQPSNATARSAALEWQCCE